MSLSNKQSRLLPLTSAAAIVAFLYSSAAAASCFPQNNFKTHTIDFGKNLADVNLTIPRDAPIGTVIYQDSVAVEKSEFECMNSSSKSGFALNPVLGTVTSGSIFTLGKIGLSFRIITPNSSYLTALSWLYPTSSKIQAGTYKLEVLKSAELSSQNVTPVGHLGQYIVDGDIVIARFNLLHPITLNTASCQAPSVPVAMGDDYELQEFNKSGNTSRAIKFNISLNQCQVGIKRVTYQLKANTQVLDA